MRLLRCLVMILAALSMASYPASARLDRHVVAAHAHDSGLAPEPHGYQIAHATHVADPCPDYHDRAQHDRGCCGNACCGPSCFSPAMASDDAFARVSRRNPMLRPGPDAAPRGTFADLLDRPPRAG